MKILQRKILILVVSSVLISALFIMSIAFLNYDRIVENDSRQIIQLMCSEKRQKIDEKLLNVKQSVHTLYHFASEQIGETKDIWSNEASYEEHISRMKALMATVVKYTDGAVSVYYYINPSIKGVKQGAWLLRDTEGKFAESEMTDISKYDKDDVEHVGWYYIPVDNGEATWINPYYNQNMGEEIVSYVIPFISEGEVVAVVGMDISTSVLYENAKAVTVYDTGYAFLMDNEGGFVYHPEMEGNLGTSEFDAQHAYLYEKSLVSAQNYSVESYQWNGIDKYLSSQKLCNEMIFSVCVAEEELQEPQTKMIIDSVLVITCVMAVYFIVTISVIKAIVRLMYTDTMTKVGNKSAYVECTDTLYKRIKYNENFSFSVVVIDINDLKKTNDTHGHECGDILIQNAASVIKNVWDRKYVYRIGGDEFAVVCLDIEKETMEKQMQMLEKEIDNFNCNKDDDVPFLQMAAGMSSYNYETDKEYMDVFRRADEAMYENKRMKKNKGKIV